MYQEIEMIGNLGRDPEMRYAPSGDPVTSFSVATNKQYTNASGVIVKEVVWFRISVWNKAAEACNTYLHKGSRVFVKGVLTADSVNGGPRIWTGQDGLPHANFEVKASLVKFLNSRQEDEQAQAQQPAPVVVQPVVVRPIPAITPKAISSEFETLPPEEEDYQPF